jgi:hypothetical protein
MKQSHKLAMGAIVASALATAVATAHAHPGQGQMGGGMEQHMQGKMERGAQSGMGHGMKDRIGHGGMSGGHGGPAAGQQLMTPEERTALREKMRNAATPAERQQIAATARTETQKRAQEKGVTLREHRGPHFGAASRAPATTEHAH